jgi:hypothetical protein
VKDCVKQRKKIDQIVEEYLDVSDKFKNGRKRKGLLLELSIIIWDAILIQLEKELKVYLIWGG